MNTPLPESAPEAQGFSSESVLAFLDGVDSRLGGLHALKILRNGVAIASGHWAPYDETTPHLLYSLSKSFTATAAGFAVSEGLFSLDDFLLDFFPEADSPDLTDFARRMRVRDALSMATGHESDATGALFGAESWPRAFFAFPVNREPGTHFVYNSAATYMISALVERTSGETLLDYLRPRLLEKIGIADMTTEVAPGGVALGGWGMSATVDSIARFGQLYLQDGVWDGARVLPEAWVETATRSHVKNGDNPDSDWAQGYGFQFWRSRFGAFRGDGAFGQYCIVHPETGLVIAILSGVSDMQALLNIVWETLLPAAKPGALPENPDDAKKLAARLDALKLPVPTGAVGKVGARELAFAADSPDNSLRLSGLSLTETVGGATTLSVHDNHGAHELSIGAGSEFVTGETTFLQRFVWPFAPPRESWTVAATGAWTGERTYEARLCFLETPFAPTLRIDFATNRATIDGPVGFGPQSRATG